MEVTLSNLKISSLEMINKNIKTDAKYKNSSIARCYKTSFDMIHNTQWTWQQFPNFEQIWPREIKSNCFLQVWSELSGPPIYLVDCRITAGAGKVCAFKSYAKRCAVYDPETDSWTELEETQHKHESGVIVFKDGLPMILGGDSMSIDHWTVEEYD